MAETIALTVDVDIELDIDDVLSKIFDMPIYEAVDLLYGYLDLTDIYDFWRDKEDKESLAAHIKEEKEE